VEAAGGGAIVKHDKTKPMKRPFATHYYSLDEKRLTADYVSQGAASTPQGAIRATVVRIFMGEYAKAVVVDRRESIVLYTIRKVGDRLQVQYGSGVGELRLAAVNGDRK
jgi:hypothetical protein